MNKALTPNYTLDFGKNIGLTLAEVYHYQPSYLEWAILKIETFKIDIDAFEKLPNPRPDTYMKENFSDKGLAKGLSARDWLKNKDMSNQFISVKEIKQFQLENNLTPKEVVYRFPENIKKVNDAK